MCGIAGIVQWSDKPPRAAVEKMLAAIASRGPDNEGLYEQEHICFGHRRLAIIDLSPQGNQPMRESDDEFILLFNGEIYNFLEIRKVLEDEGVVFRTQGDSEVILKAWKKWGKDCVRHFNGMFAIALWDTREKTLFLSRDRLGKKPLFYSILPNGAVLFASALQAIIDTGLVSLKLNPEGLNQYLSIGYTLHDNSLLADVKKLPAATSMIIKKGRILFQERYWNLAESFAGTTNQSESDLYDEFNTLFEDATRIRMISDVPLGAFLSGGVDSASVVSAMKRVSMGAVHSYSIGFHEKSYDEVDDARAAAKLLGTIHKDQYVSSEANSYLEEIARLCDEPIADNSSVPMFFLCQFARKEVTVALTGDGGDEIFGGYETYVADKIHSWYRHIPSPLSAVFNALVQNCLPTSFSKVSLEFKLRQFAPSYAMTPERAHYSWRRLFDDADKSTLVNSRYQNALFANDPASIFESYYREVPNAEPLNRMMYVDINTWLVDDILVKADRTSMAHGVELRAPLLDYRIVEFAAKLPVSLKVNGFKKKYFFKKSQERFLPTDLLYKKKRGFNAPIAHWIKDRDSEVSRILESKGPHSEFLNADYIKGLLDQHCSRKRDNSFKLYNLSMLALWMRRNPAVYL